MLHDLRYSSDRSTDSEQLWQFLTDVKRSVRCAMGVAAVTPTLSVMENFPHHPQLVGGILGEECAAELSAFFRRLRNE